MPTIYERLRNIVATDDRLDPAEQTMLQQAVRLAENQPDARISLAQLRMYSPSPAAELPWEVQERALRTLQDKGHITLQAPASAETEKHERFAAIQTGNQEATYLTIRPSSYDKQRLEDWQWHAAAPLERANLPYAERENTMRVLRDATTTGHTEVVRDFLRHDGQPEVQANQSQAAGKKRGHGHGV
jgi:hypothetical protein